MKVELDMVDAELALEAVRLLGKIRCSARRHDLDREWLTEADRVIRYWEKVRTVDSIRDAINATLEPIRSGLDKTISGKTLAKDITP